MEKQAGPEWHRGGKEGELVGPNGVIVDDDNEHQGLAPKTPGSIPTSKELGLKDPFVRNHRGDAPKVETEEAA